jgi:NADH-quinone oxidoreductase subunit B
LVDDGLGNIYVGKLRQAIKKVADGGPVHYIMNWPVHLMTACCGAEVGAVTDPRFDVERFGVLQAFGSLRQCDLLIVEGTVSRKMAPRLKRVFDQMPEPKYVIAMGACAITGGLFFDSYNVLPGIDSVVPVDVYVPGCPPRPEALIQAIIMLQDKIRHS